MERSSSAQRKVRNGSQCVKKFPFKETKSDLCRSMLETGLEGLKVGGWKN